MGLDQTLRERMDMEKQIAGLQQANRDLQADVARWIKRVAAVEAQIRAVREIVK